MTTRNAVPLVVALLGLGSSACSPTYEVLSEGGALSEPGVPTAAEIRRFVEGSWQLETWHVDDKILQPPTGRGYILFHDGVVMFTVVRDQGARTLTRFGYGEYQVADGEWSYRYHDNHYIETQGPEHDEVFEKSYFSWTEPRRFKARMEERKLVLENEGGKRTMIYDADTQTYVEDGRVVRTWKRR